MFIDITYPKMGKTNRLIDNVVDYLSSNPDETALIVAPTHQDRKKIIKKVADKCFQCQFRTISSYKMLDTDMKTFVDDFTMINEEDLLVKEGAYYTSNKTSKFNEENTIYKCIWDRFRYGKTLEPIKLIPKLKLK